MKAARSFLTQTAPVTRRTLRVTVAACLMLSVAACTVAPRSGSAAAHVPGAGGWGMAQPVRGFASLPGKGKDINPHIVSLSCASPGNCTAGGLYFTYGSRPPAHYAVVLSEVHGTWGTVRLVPGVAALEKSPASSIGPLSCAAPGDCSAFGGYSIVPPHAVRPERDQLFVTAQTGGRWHPARPFAGFAALNTGGQGGFYSLSCASPGNCTAVGAYSIAGPREGGYDHAVVASQVHGLWGRPRQPPRAAFLNAGGWSDLLSVSCAAPGECSAGGRYTSGHQITHAFVISETHGAWADPQPVSGVASPSSVVSISCGAPGDCSAIGSSANGQLFVVSQVSGTWDTATPVPGIAALNVGNDVAFSSMSCASPGNCAAGGFYALARPSGGADAPPTAAFVVSEVNGVWQRAVEVPGTASLNAGKQATITDVSCAPAGVCTAAGYYTTKADRTQAFTVSEANGVWGQAQPVRGIAALGGGASEISSISCPATGHCSAVGDYLIFQRKFGVLGSSLHAFVVNQN